MKTYFAPPLFILVAILSLTTILVGQSRSDESDSKHRLPPVESAPTFQADDLLPQKVLRGKNYLIDPEVPVQDYKFLFKIHTEYGTLPALGLSMLELRLKEMNAIAQLAEQSRDPQIVEGVFDSLKKTPEGVKILLTDPAGTLLRAPKGLQLLIATGLEEADRRAGSPTRRHLAVEIGCDPETGNPILKKLLDNVSLRKGIGQLATKAGLSLAVPGLALLPATADVRELVARKAPHEIRADIEDEMKKMGIWKPVRRKFCREVNVYTTTQRLMFMKHLRSLEGVKNISVLVYEANRVQNEAEGLTVIRKAQLLSKLHEKHRLTTVSYFGLPIGVLKDGRLVIVSGSDYLYDSKEIRDALDGFRSDYPNEKTILLTSGRVSEQAQQLCRLHRIRVVEHGQTDLDKEE